MATGQWGRFLLGRLVLIAVPLVCFSSHFADFRSLIAHRMAPTPRRSRLDETRFLSAVGALRRGACSQCSLKAPATLLGGRRPEATGLATRRLSECFINDGPHHEEPSAARAATKGFANATGRAANVQRSTHNTQLSTADERVDLPEKQEVGG